jgi:hypothetical protein
MLGFCKYDSVNLKKNKSKSLVSPTLSNLNYNCHYLGARIAGMNEIEWDTSTGLCWWHKLNFSLSLSPPPPHTLTPQLSLGLGLLRNLLPLKMAEFLGAERKC